MDVSLEISRDAIFLNNFCSLITPLATFFPPETLLLNS